MEKKKKKERKRRLTSSSGSGLYSANYCGAIFALFIDQPLFHLEGGSPGISLPLKFSSLPPSNIQCVGGTDRIHYMGQVA